MAGVIGGVREDEKEKHPHPNPPPEGEGVFEQFRLSKDLPLPQGEGRGEGGSSATAWGCDLSYDYVKINADYTSLIIPREDGGVGKDDRLTNYSPSFKRSLLVEALSYISQFAGKRCVCRKPSTLRTGTRTTVRLSAR